MASQQHTRTKKLRCTHVGTIAGSNNETTVEDKLHVAGSRSPGIGQLDELTVDWARGHLLSTGSRNVLADIRSRNDEFGLADIVVLEEDNLE